MIAAETSLVRMEKRSQLTETVVWFETTKNPELLQHAIHLGYTGVVTSKAFFLSAPELFPERVKLIVDLEESVGTDEVASRRADVIFASRKIEILAGIKAKGLPTAFRAHVIDAATLHEAIEVGKLHDYLILSFKDSTNIPLELVIASLQATRTVLIKEIAPNDLDDAVVSFGVMEVGAEGILFSPEDPDLMSRFFQRKSFALAKPVSLEVGEVITSRAIGMGYRSCIDLATLFTPTEGMLVGSTSQGGILCCPEVFHLPYMELRPFRVNAGAVHSYVFNAENRTDYMTELRAGSPIMIVDASGRSRRAYVGRVKTEVRPLRLIEVEFSEGRRVNVLMQDDWHVRVYSDDVQPRNITELQPGDRLLGHVTEPGRHVGIKVSEHILEN